MGQYIVCGHCKSYRKEEISAMNGFDSNEFLHCIGADVDFRCNCGGFIAFVDASDFNEEEYQNKGYTSHDFS